MKTYIIAEIGINANADFIQGLKLVDSAIDSGANAIKFQYWGDEYIQKCEWRDKLEGQLFSKQEMIAFKEHIERKGVDFICTAFDMESFDFVKSLNPVAYKIPYNKYVIENLDLLNEIFDSAEKFNKSIFASSEFYDDDCLEGIAKLSSYYKIPHIYILYCKGRQDHNLYKDFNNFDGVSDHSGLPEIPVAAVALGARAIEVHVTLDKNMEGPDHKTSLDIQQFETMVRMVRNVEKAL